VVLEGDSVTQPNHEQPLRLLLVHPLRKDVRAFLIDRQAGGCSPRTVTGYDAELARLCDWLERRGVHDALSITPTHLRQFLLDMAEHGHNPGGVHRMFRVAKTFLRWWQREYEPDNWRNPIERVKPPKLADNPLPPASLSDLKAMLATCDKSLAGQRDRAMLLALLDTGCRASEFCALDIGDVDVGTGAVVVRHGKGGKRRVVFLGAKTRREVMRYLRLRKDPDGGPLWVTDEGGRLTYWGLRQIVVRRAGSAGVKAPSLHSFRRAFALASKRGGMDLHDLQQLMGHADLTVLRRYLATDESDLAEAHRRAGPVDRLL
jgi:site-specific recombinase XerD